MLKKLLIITFMLVLTSCSMLGENTVNLYEDDQSIADKTFGQVVNTVRLSDADGLKNLFSEAVRYETDSIGNDTLAFIEFIKGDIVSFSAASKTGVGADCKIENGKTHKEIQSAFELQTSEDKYYVAIKECTRDDFDSNNIGVMSIYIIESVNWKQDYIYRGDVKWTFGINIVE